MFDKRIQGKLHNILFLIIFIKHDLIVKLLFYEIDTFVLFKYD